MGAETQLALRSMMKLRLAENYFMSHRDDRLVEKKRRDTIDGLFVISFVGPFYDLISDALSRCTKETFWGLTDEPIFTGFLWVNAVITFRTEVSSR